MLNSSDAGTYAHLRRLVEGRLRRPVDEALWAALAEKRWLDPYLGRSEDELVREGLLQELVEGYRDQEWLVRRYQRIRGEAPLPLPRGGPRGEEQLAEGEGGEVARARAEALAAFLAALARDEPEVAWFREQVLGGRLLSPAEARSLIASPVLALLPLEAFVASTLPRPPLGVDGLVAVEEGWPEVALRGEALPGGVVRAAWERMERLAWPGEPAQVRVAPGSVLDELRQLASYLARRYLWQEGQAAWFVLTGEAPSAGLLRWQLSGYHSHLFERAYLTLEVEPWLPPRAVMGVYRRLQRQLGFTKGVGARAVALVGFLAQHVTAHHGVAAPYWRPYLAFPPWRRLMALWNESCPERWRYRDPRHFARDCKAALRQVVQLGGRTDRWLSQ